MTNQDKQYYIYLRSADPDNRRVPCTKQQFDDYYRDINAYVLSRLQVLVGAS